jgi:hypothetical protein
MTNILEWAAEYDGEIMVLEPRSFYDECIVGVGYRCNSGPVLAYAMDKIIQKHVVEDGMSEEEASEFFHFNTLGAWMGEGTPIFIDALGKEDSMKNCLMEASNHVSRQEHAGKHEQDRADAVEWLNKWGPLMATLRGW